jgi:Domain of unknown function (DUF4440)
MKLIAGIFFAAAILYADSLSGTVQKEVLAAMETYKNGMIQKNGAALEKVLSPDLTYTHSGGQLQTKAEVIKSITSGATIIQKIEFSGTTVKVYGNMALVKGRVDLWHSPTNIIHMDVLHVWVNGPQGWQMVARQATKLAN